MPAHSATRQHGVVIGFDLGRNIIAAFLHQNSYSSKRSEATPRCLCPNAARVAVWPADITFRSPSW